VIDAGQLELHPGRHRPEDCVCEAVAIHRAIADERSVHLQAVVNETLPPVRCDVDRVSQVFSNLLSNAIRFSPAGSTVLAGATGSVVDVEFFVTDRGNGIAPDALPHLFDRYWRAPRKGSAGAGLGLFIAKGIVESHGGRIWAESKLGAGTTFRFTLPAWDADGAREMAR